jgi:Signal transduction histidine kinase
MDNLLRHNIRNDMGVILGSAELIEDTVPEAADATAVIRETAKDLLDSAEKQRGVINTLTGDSTTQSRDLTNIIETGTDLVADRYPEADISVSMPDSAPVRGIDELESAVVELIENAITHNEAAQPTVDVTVTVDDEVTLTVADNGVAIPEMESRVLTGDHEMDALYHSSGLGFWLVYRVVELSGGSISVDEHRASGNRIEVRLPYRESSE